MKVNLILPYLRFPPVEQHDQQHAERQTCRVDRCRDIPKLVEETLNGARRSRPRRQVHGMRQVRR